MKLVGRFILAILFLVAIIIFLSSEKEIQPSLDSHERTITFTKQKGAHVFARIDSSTIKTVSSLNINWMTLVSWGFQDNHKSSKLTHHNNDSVYIKQHDSSWVERIKTARSKGFKVFLKPHIWIDQPIDGKWRNYIYPNSEADWEIWQQRYTDFILRYAKIAALSDADMFCIGTELSRLVIEKPKYWKDLIPKIRQIYKGKLTYAANWNKTYKEITFWDQLDVIGIQAYFPLTKTEFPSVDEITKGWNKYITDMAALSKTYNKQIVFTELGYKSTSGSAIHPWAWAEDPLNTDKTISEETQANCYKAFFETIWPQPWFAGVHIWQLRDNYSKNDRDYYYDFTPQSKMAEQVISNAFAESSKL